MFQTTSDYESENFIEILDLFKKISHFVLEFKYSNVNSFGIDCENQWYYQAN